MSRLPLLFSGILLAASTVLGADESPRSVREAAVPGASTIVVVAEGDFEPHDRDLSRAASRRLALLQLRQRPRPVLVQQP